jgi:hypothetical protein
MYENNTRNWLSALKELVEFSPAFSCTKDHPPHLILPLLPFLPPALVLPLLQGPCHIGDIKL